jgi:hypothetical protein
VANRAAAAETALIALAFTVLFFFLPHHLEGDDWPRLGDIQSLMHGHLSSDKYSLVMPLLSAPFERLDWAFGSPTYLIERFNVVVVAIGTLVAWRLVRDRVDRGLFRKCVLVLLFASTVTNALRGFGAEVTTSTLVAVGMLAVVTGRRPALGWTAMVLGVVNTPGALGGLALVAGAQALRTRRLRSLTPVVPAGVLIGAESWLRRGSPVHTRYQHDGAGTFVALPGGGVFPYSGRARFAYPFVLGVLAILFSFGRGLMFYMPGLLLWLGRRTRQLVPGRRVVILMLLYVAGLVLFYAKWWSWNGGTSWGPRYFLFAALPASLFVAARVQRPAESIAANVTTLIVLTLSAWVGLSGGIIDIATLQTTCNQGANVCLYAPEFSSLWQPVRSFPHLTASTAIVVACAALIFSYLAAPLITAIGRTLAASRLDLSWAHGWRL